MGCGRHLQRARQRLARLRRGGRGERGHDVRVGVTVQRLEARGGRAAHLGVLVQRGRQRAARPQPVKSRGRSSAQAGGLGWGGSVAVSYAMRMGAGRSGMFMTRRRVW
jgi:hypothetical protein